MIRNIYLASSWKNEEQQEVLKRLRKEGHQVYDFHNPKDSWSKQFPSDGSEGFSWSKVDPEWRDWSNWSYLQALDSVEAQIGFQADFGAMEAADICIMLLPCGRSAHIEAGYFAGHPDKQLFIVLSDKRGDAELMYKLADGVYESIDRLIAARVL